MEKKEREWAEKAKAGASGSAPISKLPPLNSKDLPPPPSPSPSLKRSITNSTIPTLPMDAPPSKRAKTTLASGEGEK